VTPPNRLTIRPPTIPLPAKGPGPSIVELSAYCLLGKIWGEAVPLSAIIHRTRNEWKFTKGQIDYVDLGNDWVLIRFANSQDKGLVYDQRPWYVNGLNLVLIPWVPFFDPFSVPITRVDQWIRIPRLPWEFWESSYLAELLKPVGSVINIDQNTLLRLKGKFARVCVNIDVTKPLPGSVTIARAEGGLRVPLIYEGLHEVCPLCGGDSHQLNTCPNLPLSQKVEVLVEKFDATGVTVAQPPPGHHSASAHAQNNWVTVSPKKRVKALIHARPRRSSTLNPVGSSNAEGNVQPIPPSFVPFSTSAPLGPEDIILANAVAFNHNLNHTEEGDPLDALNEGLAEDNMDVYLNLQNNDDVEMSVDSSKRKRIEEGEGASSRGPI